jgi:drug/metabolite transporter (DMT)-like permease
MRERPTLRIPFGVLLLLLGLALYAGAVVWASQWIERLPTLAQALVYLVLGVAWLLPLRRFLIWMETGRWG